MQNNQILFVSEIKNAVALHGELINVRVNEEILLNKFGPLTIDKINTNISKWIKKCQLTFDWMILFDCWFAQTSRHVYKWARVRWSTWSRESAASAPSEIEKSCKTVCAHMFWKESFKMKIILIFFRSKYIKKCIQFTCAAHRQEIRLCCI